MGNSELRKRKNERPKSSNINGQLKKQAEPRQGRLRKVVRIGVGILGLGLLYTGLNLLGYTPPLNILSSNNAVQLTVDHERRDAVVNAFKHAWSAYERDAYGFDNYHPISKSGTNLSRKGGVGYMIVDVLDSLLIMNLTEEYQRAREWVAHDLTFERDDNFNTFETTIRVLGGLLSAYHLSGSDKVYYDRAVDLSARLLTAFNTPTGLPLPMVNLAKKKGVGEQWNANVISTAEAGTLQLELKYLAHLSDDDEMWDKAERVIKTILNAGSHAGLVPIYMDASRGKFIPSEIRLGSRGDSFYEYLLKQYLQTGRNQTVYRTMYEESMDGIHEHLLQRGIHENHLYTSEFILSPQQSSWERSPKQDHLVCFLGGSLMLGAVTVGAHTNKVSIPPKEHELSGVAKRDWDTGLSLIETCMDTYDSATGLSPEIVHFYVEGTERDPKENNFKDWYVKGMEHPGINPSYDARYMLRPETVESLFLAYRLTGSERFRDYGWKIFQSIEKHARVETGGYVTVLDVNDVNSKKEDRMETFFLSETLKYLYLLFSDADTIPLDKYVFNTEAHPLPIISSHKFKDSGSKEG